MKGAIVHFSVSAEIGRGGNAPGSSNAARTLYCGSTLAKCFDLGDDRYSYVLLLQLVEDLPS